MKKIALRFQFVLVVILMCNTRTKREILYVVSNFNGNLVN